MQIRQLDPLTDRSLVDAFFAASADYIIVERGEDPGPAVTDHFFGDAPPGCDPATSARLGVFAHGTLIAIAELAFGYPEPTDAYLGLMLVAPAARGTGVGPTLLGDLELRARARGANRLFLAVLDANPRGLAFWERMGFTLSAANRSVTLGTKTQIAHRLGKAL